MKRPSRVFWVGAALVVTLIMGGLAVPNVVKEISRKADEVSYQVMASFPPKTDR